MAENGEEKLLAMARHIAKTLGHNDNMADDILQIFSNFDGRFSRERLSEKMRDQDGPSLEHIIKSLDRRISHYMSAEHPIWADSADSSTFLDITDELLATIREWSPMAGERSVGAWLSRADDMLQQAMFRLEDEFRHLMERGCESFDANRAYANGESIQNGSCNSGEDEDDEARGTIQESDDLHIPVAHPVTDYDAVIDALPSGTIKDLHEIAKRMLAARFGKECSHVYSSCRREFLEESLSRLGIRKLSIDEVHKMPWAETEDEIERWIKASNVSLRILFPSERRLCDRVFFEFSSAADLSFMEVCRSSTIQLLNFVDAIAIGSRSPERLFKILDVFETLRDLIPEIDAVFSDQYCMVLRNEAITIWRRLGEAVRGIFMELENLIRRDPPKAAVPGGGLHPVTRYVMNYIRAACRSRETLEQVFDEGLVKVDSRFPTTSLSVEMAWIMELLESNLEAKSKIYKDPALCSVFMMNNGRYIVQKVKDSELGSLLGEDWIRKQNVKIRQYHLNYQRYSWSKVLGVLKQETGPVAQKSVPLKDKLKLFTSYFDELIKTQSTWVVFDDQMREELRMSVTENLLTAYSSFIGRFRNTEAGRSADRCAKYNMEDLQVRINELFGGDSVGGGGGRGNTTSNGRK